MWNEQKQEKTEKEEENQIKYILKSSGAAQVSALKTKKNNYKIHNDGP